MCRLLQIYLQVRGGIAGFSTADGWNHLAAVENAEKHCQVLRRIFPDLNVLTMDVAQVDWPSVLQGKEVDCVIGGPPCQPFSRGDSRRNGWDDDRNGIPIFVEAVRAIRPKTFLMENVAALWWEKYRHHIEEIITQFKVMGFAHTEAVMFDAADFGAPCHRQRLFVYGTQFPHNLPQKTHTDKNVAARQYLTPLLEARDPDGAPLPEWVLPKIKGPHGDIIIDCKQRNKMGRPFRNWADISQEELPT